MPRAVLHVHVPDSVWIGKLTRRYTEAEFRILTAFPGEETGVAMAEITANDVESIIREMHGYEEVVELDLIRHVESEALVQFETSDPVLLLPIQASKAPLDLPFTVQDGQAKWEVTATRDRLSDLGDQLRTLNISFDVESVTQLVETERLLTDRQMTLVETAIEEGYYDTPRDCTLTELADCVDIAKSTASETLHRAEEKIVKEYVDGDDSGGVRVAPTPQ